MKITPELIDKIQDSESFRSKPYKDTKGFWTIGFGRNLDARGISRMEASFLLGNDLRNIVDEITNHPRLEWFFKPENLDQIRQEVLADLAFNMGLGGLLQFENMLAAIKNCDYALAARELQDSRYFDDVGDGVGGFFDRAEANCLQLRTGVRQQRG